MRRINTKSFQRATRGTSREVNRRILLNLVRDRQPISRAHLARLLGMSRSMVSSLVNELIAGKFLLERGTADTPLGRKPRLLHIRDHDRLVVGIDIERRQTHVALSDFGGKVISSELFPTPRDVNELVSRLTDRVHRLIQAHHDVGECMGVGLVVPGAVDAGTGIVLNSPTMGWRNVDIRGALAVRVPVPVFIERDAVACALAKMWQRGRAEHYENFVYLTVSDGVGAGLVVNGQVIRGRRHAAGEFGHVPLSLDGPLCYCGRRGCWQAFTCNAATVARCLGEEADLMGSASDIEASRITVEDVIHRAQAGDVMAKDAIVQTGWYLGIGLATIINALSPAQIIVGGAVVAAWHLIEPAIEEALAERALTDSAAATPIIPELSDRNTRLQGAAVLVVGPTFAAPVVA